MNKESNIKYIPSPFPASRKERSLHSKKPFVVWLLAWFSSTASSAFGTFSKCRRESEAIFLRLGVAFFLVIFLSFFIIPSKSYAGETEPESAFAIDEVLIVLYVKDLGTTEIPSAIRGQDVYLPVVDVFNFLKIRVIPANGFDMVSGFFIDPKNTYQIDRLNNLIIYQGKTFSLSPNDFIVTETNIYLKSRYFGEVFGLASIFNFRSLTVIIKSEVELPAIREMRLEQMRLNFDRLRGQMKADTNIVRKYSLFHFGMADWAINTNQQVNGTNNAQLFLGLGAVLAGGELNSLLLYQANQPFLERQQYYLWRYADNENKVLRQVMAGKIATQSVSSIFNPVIGIQITNTPTVNRKSFGTYTLRNYTKPNWTVELYVNNILIDYVKADASGFFTFDVPLIYGNTDVTLRYYGPWGEELSSKQSFNIPFNFLPPKEWQYKISSALIQDDKNSLFGQARLNYGLTRTITIGGGIEYNSSILTTKRFSFFNTSIRLGSNVLFSGEYLDGVRYTGLLNYNLPSNLRLELYYGKYNPDQRAILLNYTEERRLMIAKPFRIFSTSALSQFTISQNLLQQPNSDLPPTKFTIPQLTLSGAAHGIGMNITTSAFIIHKIHSSVFSDVSLSTTLLAGILFTPQIRFDYKLNTISLVKYSVEKRFKYSVIEASYQHDLITKSTLYQVGFRYNFSHARVGFTAMQINNRTSLLGFASGSLIYQPQLNYLDINVNRNVGRGGLVFLPFLDINNNGKKDSNEVKVSGLNVMVSGGGIQKISKDTTIVISGLEPYTNYFVELDGNSFENMAWQIKKPKMNIAIEPNKLKLIEVPISIVGEASGTVYIKKKKEETGLGRILVCFYNKDSVLVNKTLTESDGYFNFFGLLPGSYYAKIDLEQLNKLQMASNPSSFPFTIKSGIDGDYVDDLKFTLQTKVKGTTKSVPEKQLVPKLDSLPELVENKAISKELKTISPPQISDTLKQLLVLMVKHREDSIKLANQQSEIKIVSPPQISDTLSMLLALMVKHKEDSIKIANKQSEIKIVSPPQISDTLSMLLALRVKHREDFIKQAKKQPEIHIAESPVINEQGNFAVQVRAHSQLPDAKATQFKLSKIYKQPVVIVNEGGLYKVRISGFNNRNEALEIIPKLEVQGFDGAFIISPAKNTGSLKPIGKQPEGNPFMNNQQKKGIPEKQVNTNTSKQVSDTPVNATKNPGLNKQGIYAVQARAHSQLRDARATQSKLSKIYKQPVVIVNEGGLYKVRISGFNNSNEALSIIPKLEAQGFVGAFIISPDKNTSSINPAGKTSLVTLLEVLSGENKSERVLTQAELARIEEVVVNKNNVIKRSKFGDKAIYAIQIASHEDGLPQNTLAVVYKLETEVESYKDNNNGLTRYFTGNYNSYKEAVKAKNELVKKGFINPFIIVIHKGEIISVKEYNSRKK